jgi:hypothetical protein
MKRLLKAKGLRIFFAGDGCPAPTEAGTGSSPSITLHSPVDEAGDEMQDLVCYSDMKMESLPSTSSVMADLP